MNAGGHWWRVGVACLIGAVAGGLVVSRSMGSKTSLPSSGVPVIERVVPRDGLLMEGPNRIGSLRPLTVQAGSEFRVVGSFQGEPAGVDGSGKRAMVYFEVDDVTYMVILEVTGDK